jgi:hypothetical protein
MQAYSDPRREDEPTALPDVEVFHHDCTDSADPCPEPFAHCEACADFECGGIGWYWQSCFPGCLPDGDPCGPFETEAEALADAREGNVERCARGQGMGDVDVCETHKTIWPCAAREGMED